MTKFELRKLISERILILQEADENSNDFSFDSNINTDAKEIKFRQWMNSGGNIYHTIFKDWLKNNGYTDEKLDSFIPEKPKNLYVKAAWNLKIDSEDNKTIGQLYVEKVLNNKVDNQEIADGAKDLNEMKDFNWDNIVEIVKAQDDQLSAEILILLYAKWCCSKVDDEGYVETDGAKWKLVKNEIGDYLKLGISAEKDFKDKAEKDVKSADAARLLDASKDRQTSAAIKAIENAEKQAGDVNNSNNLT